MTKREWQLALPLLLGLALCAAGFAYGLKSGSPGRGIGSLRVFQDGPSEKVAVVLNGSLQVLDATGRRLSRQPLVMLGLQDAPNDMDWATNAQGQVEAWFFDDTGPRVLRCLWRGDKSALADCSTAMAGAQLKVNQDSGSTHLALDLRGQRVFLADTKGHAVQVFDLSGKPVTRTATPSIPLFFPNRLRFMGDDMLVVADNDHYRLAWLRFRHGQPPEMQGSLLSTAHPEARADHRKVTDAAFSKSGTIWMLAVKQGQKDGDILVFDTSHKPLVRAALPPGADPLIVEALGETALAADYSFLKLHHIDASGRYLGEFGDAAFKGELDAVRAETRQASYWRWGSLAFGALIVLSGMLLGRLYGEKPSKPA